MGTKAKLSTKVLSLFLSVLMAASCFGIALPNLVPEASAATASETQWQALEDALTSAFNGGYLSTDGYAVNTDDPANVTVTDTTKEGYLYGVVRAVGDIAKVEGVESHNTALADRIITKVEANDYQAAFIRAILPAPGKYGEYDGTNATATWNGSNEDLGNLPTDFTFTTTVTRNVKGAILSDYESVFDIPAAVDCSYTLAIEAERVDNPSEIPDCDKSAYYQNTEVTGTVTTANAPDLSAIKNYVNFVNNTAEPTESALSNGFANGFAAWLEDTNSVYAEKANVLEARYNAFISLHHDADAIDTDYVEKFIGHQLMNSHLSYANAARAAAAAINAKKYVDWLNGVPTEEVVALDGYMHRDNYTADDVARMEYLRGKAQTYLNAVNATGDATKALLKEQYGYLDTYVVTTDTAPVNGRTYFKQVQTKKTKEVTQEDGTVATVEYVETTYEAEAVTAETIAGHYVLVSFENYILDLTNKIELKKLADIRTAAQYLMSKTVADAPYVFPAGTSFGNYQVTSDTAAEAGKTYYTKDAYGFYVPAEIGEGGVAGLYEWVGDSYYGMGNKTYRSEDYVTAGNVCPVNNIELQATSAWFDSATSYISGVSAQNRNAVFETDEVDAISAMASSLTAEIAYRAFDDNSEAFRNEYAYFVNLKLSTDLLLTSNEVLMGYTYAGVDANNNPVTVTVDGLIKTASDHYTALNNAFNAITGSDAATRARYQTFVTEAYNYITKMYQTLLDRSYDEYYALYNAAGRQTNGNGVNASNFTQIKGMIANLDDNRDTPYTEAVENTLRNWINTNASTIVSKVGGNAQSRINLINNIHNTGIPAYLSKAQALTAGGWGAFGNRYYNDFVTYTNNTGVTGSTGGTNTYVVRDGRASDMVRADNNKDYVVTTARINSVITKLDNFASSADFVKMIGVYDTYDSAHQVTNLSTYIKNLLEENLFTDDMVNTFVAMLFPMLTDLVENKLISMVVNAVPGASVTNPKGAVHLNLNTMAQTMIANGQMEPTYSGGDDYGGSAFSAGYTWKVWTNTLSGNLDIYLNGTASGVRTFRQVFEDLNVRIYPSSFASYLSGKNSGGKYTKLINKLNSVNDNWMGFDADSDGEVTKADFEKLGLTYGIKDYATFITVMGDMLGAAGPLINTLFTNYNFSASSSNLVRVNINSVSMEVKGSAHATGFWITLPSISIDRTVRVEDTEVYGSGTIGIDGMLGYNDLWAPIMEGLGITGTTSARNVGTNTNSTTPFSTTLGTSAGAASINEIVNGMFLPLINLINKVANKPIDTVLGMLPNLAYNIAYNNVTPLLDCLKTTMHVDASVNFDSFGTVEIVDIVSIWGWTPNLDVTWLGNLFAGKIRDMINGMLNFNPNFDIGGLIDLDSVLPFDITNLNDIVGFLVDKLSGDEVGETQKVDIPAINTAHLGRLGDRVTRSSIRSGGGNGNTVSVSKGGSTYSRGPGYYIQADKADVLVEIIDLVMDFISKSGSLSGLMASFGSSGLGSDIEAILGEIDSDKSLAALVELFEPQVYNMAAYNWYQPNSAVSTYNFGTQFNQANFAYLKYANMWTREKADYMYNNLEKVLDDVTRLIDSDMLEEGEGFSAWLDKTVNKMFNNKNVNGFLKALVKLAAGMDGESKTVANILKDQLKVNNTGNVDIFNWYYRFGYLYSDYRVLGTHEVADPESPTGVKTVNEVLYLDKDGNICVGYPETEKENINGVLTDVTVMHFVRTYPLAPSGFAGFVENEDGDLVPAASGSNLPGRTGQANITYVYSPKYNTSHTKRYTNYTTTNINADNLYNTASYTVNVGGTNRTFTNRNSAKNLFINLNPVILAEPDEEGNIITWAVKGDTNTSEFGLPSGYFVPLVDGNVDPTLAVEGYAKPAPKARAAFMAIVSSLLEPLAPAFSFILNGNDLNLFNSALTIKGYDVYNGAIIPLLEAAGVRDLLTSQQYKTQYNNNAMGGFYYLANKVFSTLDDLLTDSSEGGGKTPVQKVIDLLPGLYYYLQSDGLSTLLKNVLMPIWVLVDDIRPIADVNLDLILHNIAAKLLDVDPEAASGSGTQNAIANMVMKLVDMEPILSTKAKYKTKVENAIRGVHLKDLKLKSIAELASSFTGMNLDPLFYAFEGMCNGYTLDGTTYGVKTYASKHYDIAYWNANPGLADQDGTRRIFNRTYTLTYTGPDTITVTICAVLDLLRYQGNAAALDEMIGLTRDLLPGQIASSDLSAAGLLEALEVVFEERGSLEYQHPNWDYILEGKLVKNWTDGNTIVWTGKWEDLLRYSNFDTLELHNKHDEVTKRALGYKTDWTRETAQSMDTMFATVLDYVTTSFLAREDDSITSFSDYINDLIDNKLLGADLLMKLGSYIALLFNTVPASVVGVVDNMLETNLSSWLTAGYIRKGVATTPLLDEDGEPVLDEDGDVVYEDPAEYYVNENFKWWATTPGVQLDDNGNVVLDNNGNPVTVQVPAGEDYVDTRDKFFNAITALLQPISKLIGFICLDEGYRYFYSVGDTITSSGNNSVSAGDDVDAIILEGAGAYRKGLIPLFEALGIEDILDSLGTYGTWDQYKPGKYYNSTTNEYNNDLFVSDLVVLLRALAEGVVADPLNWLLDNLPNIIYFINAEGVSTSIKNIFDSVQDVIDMVNTQMDYDEQISTSNIGGINLSDLSLAGVLKMVQQFTSWDEKDDDGNVIATHAGLYVRDDLIEYIKGLYIGDLTHFISNNGKDAFRMDCSEEEDRADLITVFLSLVIEIAEDSGRFVDPNNNYNYSDYNNPEVIDHLAKTDGLVAQIINAIKNPTDLVYTNVDWYYFDKNVNIADVAADEEGKLLNVPGYMFQYLNYTTQWTYTKAATTANGLEDMIISVLGFVDEEKYGEMTSLGELINTETIYNGDLLQKLMDLIAKYMYGPDSILSKELLNVIGCLLGADLTQWDPEGEDAYAFAGAEAFEGKTLTMDEDTGLEYAVLPVMTAQLGEDGKPVKDEEGNVVMIDTGDTIRTYKVSDRESFVKGVNLFLQPAHKLLNWLLFGENYEFFTGNTASTENDILITVQGSEGYSEGLVLLLEALGCKDLKYASFYKTADGGVNTDAFMEDILTSLCNRIDEIIADPVTEIANLIPELIYFINAGGLQAVVANLLAGPLALVNALNALTNDEDEGEEITDEERTVVDTLVTKILNDSLEEQLNGNTLTFTMSGINLQYIFEIVELVTGLEITNCVGNSLALFRMGDIVRYNSMGGEGKVAYRMVFSDTEDFADFITILLSLVVDVLKYDDGTTNNAEVIANLLIDEDDPDTQVTASIVYSVLEFLKEGFVAPDIKKIDWLYFDANYALYDSDGELKDPAPEYDYTVADYQLPPRFINYLTYASDWTDELANYIYTNRNELALSVLKLAKLEDTEVLGIKLADLFNGSGNAAAILNNLYTGENLNAILKGIKDLAAKAPSAVFDLLNIVLDIDLNPVLNHEGFGEGQMTREEFVAGLTEIIDPLAPVLDWLLFGKSMRYFDKNNDVPQLADNGQTGIEVLLEIQGSYGYDYGLIPMMEALGIEGLERADLLSCTDNMLQPILNAVLNRLEAILQNPVDGLLDVVPNLIYFVNSRGLINSMTNLLAAPVALLNKINDTLDPGGDHPENRIGINTLLAEMDIGNTDIDILNLNLESVLKLVEDLLGVKIMGDEDGFIQIEKIQNFYFGEVILSRSANGDVRGQMVYTEEEDRADMLTLLVNFFIEFALFEWTDEEGTHSNAQALEKFLQSMEVDIADGTITGVIEALDTLASKVVPGNYHWNYFNEPNDEFDNTAGYTEAFYAAPATPFANYLTYDTKQSWTKTAANALYANLADVLDNVIAMTAEEGAAQTVSEILKGSFNLYTAENLNAILGGIETAYDAIGEEFITVLGLLLGADLTSWNGLTFDEAAIKDKDSFRIGLMEILKPLYPVLDWLLFGKDYGFFVADDNGNTSGKDDEGNYIRLDGELLKIAGSYGYAYAIVPLLETLGVKDLPACKVGTTTCGTKVGEITFFEVVVDKILDRVDEILDAPVDEALELLPQILYFINANGLATMIENLTGAVMNAANQLVANGTIPLDDAESVQDYVYNSFNIDIRNLDLEGIFAFLETFDFMQGLKLNDVFTRTFTVNAVNSGVKENILEYFYIGAGAERKNTSVTNSDGSTYAVYKLRVNDGDKGDLITMLFSIVLEVLFWDANEEPLTAIIGNFLEGFTVEDFRVLKALLQSGVQDVEMRDFEWAYFVTELSASDAADVLAKIAAGDETVLDQLRTERTQNYLTYDAKNNPKMLNLWSEDAVSYVDENLNDIVDRVIDLATEGEYHDLNALIKNNLDVFSDETARLIIDAVTNAISGLDDILFETAGSLLGVENMSGIKHLTVQDGEISGAKDTSGKVTTASRKAAFVAKLTELTNYLNPVLDWILFNGEYRFFTQLEDGKPHTLLIKGGEGYKYGLAPILNALGVSTEISAEKASTAMSEILMNVADRIEEILDNPIDEVLELIPELIYFINANGLTVCVNNLAAPIDALLKTAGPAIGQDDLSLKTLAKDYIDLDNLNFTEIYRILKEQTGLILSDDDGEPIGSYLSKFYFGMLEPVTIYDDLKGFKMGYTENDQRYDVVTILVTLVLDVIVYDGNRTAIINLLKNVSEDKADAIYNSVVAILTHNEKSVAMVPYRWILTEYATDSDDPEKAGKLLSPMTMGGSTFGSSIYGKFYTREMGEYITKFFPLFVDTYITLLGIEAEGGDIYRSLDDLLKGLIGDSVYQTSLLESIASGVSGAIGNLRDMLGDELFDYVVGVLERSLKVDLTALEEGTMPAIEDGDRDAFVQAISDYFSPVAPILRWLLTGQSISLFTDRNGDDYIVLNGAQGYQDSIIPIMEALHVPADSILTQAEYEAATDRSNTENDPDKDAAMLENILNPIFDRVDEIVADPLNEIFDILPAVAYFVNSKGLDSAFKNLLNAVYQLLETIDPVIADVEDLHKTDENGEKYVSLYPLMSKRMAELDLEELTFGTLADLALDKVNEAVDEYGFELTGVLDKAIYELTLGIVTPFMSKRVDENGNSRKDYTMDYAGNAGTDDKVDMVSIILRIILNFISKPANVRALEKLLEGKLSEEGYKFLCALLENFQQMVSTEDGIQKTMYTVYYVFYSALNAGVATNNGLANFNGNYSFLNQLFATSEYSFIRQLEQSFGDLLNKWTSDVVDDDEVAPKGLIKFFQGLINFFKKILNFFKGLFG